MSAPFSRRDRIVTWLLFGLFAGLYATALPSGLAYGGGDGAELTVVAASLGLAHPTGYPLFTWLGFLFSLLPSGEVARRVAMMSAVLGAGGVAMLYPICRRLDVRPSAAAFAAGLFGVSVTFSSQAVITEVYAPNVFLVALTLWRLLAWERSITAGMPAVQRDRQLAVVALLLGASLGTHMSNLGFAPAFALFVLVADRRVLTRPRALALVTAAFLLGAAQFLWLPLRAHAFDLFPNAAPDTPAGVYAYTLGAFRNLRFAFPLADVGGRVALYERLLIENFTLPGVALGYVGVWVLWWRRPAAFWLLLGMYAVHVVFFTQLSVPDFEVFFIPSHLLFAILVGVGLDGILGFARARFAGTHRRTTRAATVVALGALYAPLVGTAATRVPALAGRLPDTSLADYYENVFDALPPGSVLVGSRGAFGSDLAYWHRVCRRRPDVWVPSLSADLRPPVSAPVFTTRGTPPFGAPNGFVPARAWYVPVLLGGHRDLTLFRVQTTPPALMVIDPAPAVRLDRELGGATLVGGDLALVRPLSPARVHVTTYWRATPEPPVVVTTRVDDIVLEAHVLGFGNLRRYLDEVGELAGGTLVEAFDLVLPSGLSPGRHVVQVGHIELTRDRVTPHWAELGAVATE